MMDTCIPEPADNIRKQVYEVFPDGRVRHYIYNDYSRKSSKKENLRIPFKIARELLSDIDRCFQPENFRNPHDFWVYDNRGYQLVLTYDDGSKMKYDGTFGGGPIDTRMQEFIDRLSFESDDTNRGFRICPYCGSDRVIPIVYGYPSMETFEEADKGNIKLGGCVVSMDGSDYIAYCKDCDASWSEDMLTVDMIKKVRYVTETCGLEAWDDHKKYVYELFPDGKIKYRLYKGYSKTPSEKEVYETGSSRVVNLYADLRKYSRSDYRSLLIEADGCDGSSYVLDILFSDGTKLTFDGYCYGGTFDSRMSKFLRVNKIGDYE